MVPVAFSVIHQVLDMNRKLAALTDLCNGFGLEIIAPVNHSLNLVHENDILHSHCAPDTLFTFESILCEEELALLVRQQEPAGPAFEAFLVKSLFFEQDTLCDNLMAHITLLFELVVITFSTSWLPLNLKLICTCVSIFPTVVHLDAVRRPRSQLQATGRAPEAGPVEILFSKPQAFTENNLEKLNNLRV